MNFASCFNKAALTAAAATEANLCKLEEKNNCNPYLWNDVLTELILEQRRWREITGQIQKW
jgi:hypothetical protein